MLIQLLKLELLKTMRSTAFAKSALIAIFLAFLGTVLLSYVLLIGLFLKDVIIKGFGKEDAYVVVSGGLIYFYLVEFIYRYFLQKLPVMDLAAFLHLPIKKKSIVHFLIGKSYISPLSLIAPLLFAPFAFTEIGPKFGDFAAWSWLLSVVFSSWALHGFILWFKQKFEDRILGIVVVFIVFILGSGSTYFGWFNLGDLMKPLFDWALISWIPVLSLAVLVLAMYTLAFNFYRKNAYLEDLVEEEEVRFANREWGIFNRFGLAGQMANLEWKLIIRHKKSRTYLMLASIMLFYGLIFYNNPAFKTAAGFQHMFVFVGVFITGIFMLQYGQLFLSWNSSNFDFFLTQRKGVEALVKGKYLLFIATSTLFFLLSVPYVYFGLDILLIHLAAYVFNIGVLVHVVIHMALWKPKPMDLNKGAMFNYEGVGAAQFLMMLPIFIGPYLIYLPFALLIHKYAGLLAMLVVGLVGLFSFPYLSKLAVDRVIKNRYEISSSFRQEL